MKIIKQINSNAALALDGNGRELVVLGRGVGFPKTPYELQDLSRVERTFYDVDPKHYRMITSLPHEILMASADLSEIAEDELNCTLNPNLPFTLADHLHFATQRLEQNIQILTPLAYDVEHLYPQEYLLGCDALDILEQYTGVRLPESEAVSVTLHILNAEIDKNDMHDTLMQVEILNRVDQIIQQQMGIQLQTSSFAYSRFNMHLRYLIQRLSTGAPAENGSGIMLRSVARDYPAVYACAGSIARYLKESHGWECTDDEVLYLMLHIHRLSCKSS